MGYDKDCGASQLFQGNVPEKVIQERTGHRSLEALRQYERTTTEQHKAVSWVLGSEKPVAFQTVIQRQEKQETVTRSALSPLTNIAPVLNMSGCTVNIQFNQPLPPPPPPPFPEITKEELDEMFFGLLVTIRLCYLTMCYLPLYSLYCLSSDSSVND